MAVAAEYAVGFFSNLLWERKMRYVSPATSKIAAMRPKPIPNLLIEAAGGAILGVGEVDCAPKPGLA